MELCSNADQVFVIGGSSVYEQCLDIADFMYITWVHGDFPGDTFFPEVDFSQWEEISKEDCEPDSKNKHPYTFTLYKRK
jgi:dihydrofolate reductase